MKATFTRLQQALVLLLLCVSLSAQAQMKVGQPAGSPDPSAALDVSGGPYSSGSQYRGIAPPKVALSQTSTAAPVTNPTTGLLVYNTAKSGDVTPGYYYWEGNKWVRLSTATTGAARVAAAGDPIPAYTLDQVHNLVINGTPSATIFLVEPGREGLFHLDDTADITKGLDAMVLVTATPNAHRYKRVVDAPAVNVTWFGARGDIIVPANEGAAIPQPAQQAITANTSAIQAAVDYVAATARIADIYPVAKGHPNRLYFPGGTYYIDGTVNVSGPLSMYGDGGLHSGGTVIANRSTAVNVFEITGSQLGGQLALQVSEIRFRGHWAGGSIFYAGPTGSLNSLYFNRCWFQRWAQSGSALKILKSDDLQVVQCTFDTGVGSAFYLGDMGSPTNVVSNCTFSDNTFFHIGSTAQNAEAMGHLYNVDGFIFSANRCYKSSTEGNITLGIDALVNSVKVCITEMLTQVLRSKLTHPVFG